MTKKEFKSMLSNQTYTGWNGCKTRINAFFFDWKFGDYKEDGINKNFRGFRYMVAADSRNITKAELLEMLYKWVNNQVVTIPGYVRRSFAANDKDRFKVPLSMGI